MKAWLWWQLIVLKASGLALVVWTDLDLPGWILFFAGGCVVMAHHFLPRSQGLCDTVTSFEAKGREVWLTIDDGPDPDDTPAILALLEAYDARATFFMIGARAARHPELVERVIAAGHSIGSHTQTHPLWDFWCAGLSRVRRELDESLRVLNSRGASVCLFRAPVGIQNVFLQRCLRERALRCVAWTVRSGDGTARCPERVVARVLREVRSGAILLMHEGAGVAPQVRLVALENVLRGLANRGYRCVLPEANRLRCG